jgi:hypothetical protein
MAGEFLGERRETKIASKNCKMCAVDKYSKFQAQICRANFPRDHRDDRRGDRPRDHTGPFHWPGACLPRSVQTRAAGAQPGA